MGVTPNLGLQLPVVGNTQDAWGTMLNNDLQVLDGLAATPPVTPSTSGTVLPANASETVELCTAGAGGITRTLPDPAIYAGRIFVIKKIDAGVDAGGGAVNVVGSIDGAAGYALVNQWQYLRVVAAQGSYFIIGNN